MRILIATDHHFVRDHSGDVLVGHPFTIAGYRSWEPYLEVFDEVLVLARVRRRAEEHSNGARADGPRVSFYDLPDYLGPWEYARDLFRLRRGVRQALKAADAFIFKVPSAIGQMAWRALGPRGRAYGLEVISDPWDMYSPGAVPSVVRPVVRHRWSATLRRMCREAPSVLYVTREALQRRYPPGPRSWATYASDVEIPGGLAGPEAMARRIGRLAACCSNQGAVSTSPQVGFVGSFAQMYKAPDILLRATALCRQHGLNFRVSFVGDGQYRAPMEALAGELGLSDQVRFLGALPPGRAVQEFLDGVDLFVLPSLTEGLPRALVEAMARGCPCLGSTVGGIPELLDPEDLVPPGDVKALAAKLGEALTDGARLERMIHRNMERAKEFQPGILLGRKLDFYRKVHELAGNERAHQHASG